MSCWKILKKEKSKMFNFGGLWTDSKYDYLRPYVENKLKIVSFNYISILREEANLIHKINDNTISSALRDSYWNNLAVIRKRKRLYEEKVLNSKTKKRK